MRLIPAQIPFTFTLITASPLYLHNSNTTALKLIIMRCFVQYTYPNVSEVHYYLFYTQGASLDMLFNADKSYLFIESKNYDEVLPVLSTNSVSTAWVNSMKYLGIKLVSDKSLNIDISPVMQKFYAAVNAIFSHCKYVSEFTKLHLLIITLPMLMYGLNVIFLSQTQLMKLNFCWNRIYRKIISYFKWESVKTIQMFCERLDVIHLLCF